VFELKAFEQKDCIAYVDLKEPKFLIVKGPKIKKALKFDLMFLFRVHQVLFLIYFFSKNTFLNSINRQHGSCALSSRSSAAPAQGWTSPVMKEAPRDNRPPKDLVLSLEGKSCVDLVCVGATEDAKVMPPAVWLGKEKSVPARPLTSVR
jgi:hypothetical protein